MPCHLQTLSRNGPMHLSPQKLPADSRGWTCLLQAQKNLEPVPPNRPTAGVHMSAVGRSRTMQNADNRPWPSASGSAETAREACAADPTVVTPFVPTWGWTAFDTSHARQYVELSASDSSMICSCLCRISQKLTPVCHKPP